MTLLGASSYTVTRQPGHWVEGVWSANGEPTTFAIIGCAQLATAREVEMLPEGARTSARLILYVEAGQADLHTTDISAQTVADEIAIDGRDYMVLSEADWRQAGIGLRHRAYALAEVGEDE